MKSKLIIVFLLIVLLLSGCSPSYNGPYANTPLVTKDDVKKQIAADDKLINDSKTPLLKQVQAKSDVKYFIMLLTCYENYENVIKGVDGKEYALTASNINQFIKMNNFTVDLKLIEPNKDKWPSIFLGNLARYFTSLGFSVYVNPSLKEENIIIKW